MGKSKFNVNIDADLFVEWDTRTGRVRVATKGSEMAAKAFQGLPAIANAQNMTRLPVYDTSHQLVAAQPEHQLALPSASSYPQTATPYNTTTIQGGSATPNWNVPTQRVEAQGTVPHSQNEVTELVGVPLTEKTRNFIKDNPLKIKLLILVMGALTLRNGSATLFYKIPFGKQTQIDMANIQSVINRKPSEPAKKTEPPKQVETKPK